MMATIDKEPKNRDRSVTLWQAFCQKARHTKWWLTLRKTKASWTEEDGDQRAAAFAYYLLLSLMPLALLLVAAGSFFVERDVATQAIIKLVNHYTPMTSEQERETVATNLASFNALYGALGGIVAFLLWLYLSSCMAVFGICLCAASAKVREGEDENPKKETEG